MPVVVIIVLFFITIFVVDKLKSASLHNSIEREAEKRHKQMEERMKKDQEDYRRRMREEQTRRDKEKKQLEEQSDLEAEKLVPAFLRSDLTANIIKAMKTNSIGTIVEIHVTSYMVTIVTAVDNKDYQKSTSRLYFSDWEFQSLEGHGSRALAKALEHLLSPDYEYKGLKNEYDSGFFLVEYKHRDKLKKLRSAI